MRLDYSNPSAAKLPGPPGFAATAKDVKSKSDAEATKTAMNANEVKLKRAWELAFSPAKSLPMQAVMLYFSGSGVQIFSLGMIFMLLTGPIGAISGILHAFEPFRTVKHNGELTYQYIIPAMFTFAVCQLAVLALGLYKCWTMGILPSGPADWLQFETRPDWPEWSAVRAMILGQ